jgi:hypothetical protein
MIASCGPPMAIRPTLMTVSCGWNARLASLNGRASRLTDSTPGQTLDLLPVDRPRLAQGREPHATVVLGPVHRQTGRCAGAPPHRRRPLPGSEGSGRRASGTPGTDEEAHARLAWAREIGERGHRQRTNAISRPRHRKAAPAPQGIGSEHVRARKASIIRCSDPLKVAPDPDMGQRLRPAGLRAGTQGACRPHVHPVTGPAPAARAGGARRP